jgi:hypothetical protein
MQVRHALCGLQGLVNGRPMRVMNHQGKLKLYPELFFSIISCFLGSKQQNNLIKEIFSLTNFLLKVKAKFTNVQELP